MYKTDFIFCFYLTGFWFLFFKGIFSFLSVSWSEEKIAHLYFPFLPSHFGAETSIPVFFFTYAMFCGIVHELRCENSGVTLPGAPGWGLWLELADGRSERRPAARALPASCRSSCPAWPPAVRPCHQASQYHLPVTCGAGGHCCSGPNRSGVLRAIFSFHDCVLGIVCVFLTWRRLEEAEFSSAVS